MMNVTRSSVFPASCEEVFCRLQRLETLQRVAWPYATFEPHSLRWTVLISVFHFCLALAIAFVVYHVAALVM